MKLLRYFLLYLLFFGFSQNKLVGQINSQQIDSIIQKAMDQFAVAGVAVAVVKDGKIVHQKGYGVKNIETGEKVDAYTNFAIASNSKAFTSTALALLVEEGKLSWSDKVVDIIPEFRMYDDYTTLHFNIEDLLTHRSGLGLGMGDLMFFPDGADFTINDIIKNFQYFKPTSAFRTKFDYDNLLYLVAGEVIKRVSRKPWEDFIQERIFKPLQMNHSYTSITQLNKKSNFALPHLNQEKKIRVTQAERWDPKKINGAAGGIYANVHDLSHWLLLHLNHGKYGKNLENQLFKESTQQKMWRIHTVLPVQPDPRYHKHFAGYGLGWFLSDIKGNKMVSHTGGLMGMLSKTTLIPDQNLGIVILTNTYLDGAGLFSAVSQSIVDKYLGMDHFDWIEYYADRYHSNEQKANTVVEKIWKEIQTTDVNHPDLKKFTGTYEDIWFGKILIKNKNNRLWFQSVRSPKLSGPMYYYKADTFIVKWKDNSLVDADAFVMFELNENGEAKAFKMKGISPAIDFSYDFQDLYPKKINFNK